jgi:phospholipase/carboxylesterase
MREDRRQAASGTDEGRLLARPGAVTDAGTAGLQSLGLASGRDTLLYVPTSYDPQRPAPFAVLLHGAGGDAQGGMSLLQAFADEFGLLLLAPASQSSTWDVIRSGFGPDVTMIDQALAEVWSRYNVDRARIGIGGFSDGASYALSLGLTNGDLFSHVIAFSPGFMAPADQRGTPQVYISHGTHDDVLPIERCSRRLVPLLKRSDYDVVYHEFDGPHAVPASIAREATAWFAE